VRSSDDKETKQNDDLKTFTTIITKDETTDSEDNSENIVDPEKITDIIITDEIYKEDSTMEKEITPLNDLVNTSLILNQTQILTRNDAEIQDNQTQSTTDSAEKTTSLEYKDIKLPEQSKNNVKILPDTDKQSAKPDKGNLQEIISKEIAEDLKIEALNTEGSESETGSDLMQNQSPQEYSVKAMIHGDLKFEDVNLKVISQNVVKQAQDVTPAKIVEQITKQMEGLYNSSKVNIVLNPESLGRLNIQLLNTKEGLTAQFTVMTQEARDLIMKGLDGLRESLLAQGVSVDNLVVKMNESSDLGNSENQFKWGEGSRGGNKERGSKNNKEEEKPFEQMMYEINQNGKV
jgi:flagellar hook-length control protein FliK